jgi:hypothetical protein
MRHAMILVLVLAGCGQELPSSTGNSPAEPGASPRAADANAAPPGGAANADAAFAGPNGAADPGRKIIHTADIDLVVEEFGPIPDQVRALARQSGGYIAKSNLRGSTGRPRGGDWTLRVPTDKYDSLLDELESLGEVRRSSSNSQDVSEEYYDVEARIRNKKQEETRLLRHLEESTGRLEDILLIEKELSRVRGEVERMEGRLRVLADLTTLTTIHLTVEEIKNYVPPAAPTFATQIGRSFDGSWGALVDFGKGLTLLVVILSPWLVAMGTPALIVALTVRRVVRRRQALR